MTFRLTRLRALAVALVATLPLVALIPHGNGSGSGAPHAASSAATLAVNGNELENGNGQRFVVKGVNVEAGRDLSCAFNTNTDYSNLKSGQLVAAFQNLGINAIRLNISSNNVRSGFQFPGGVGYIQALQDYINILGKAGIYTMVSDHDYTNSPLSNYQNSWPVFDQLIANNQGNPYFLLNPYNEPNNVSWGQWLGYMTNTINHFRSKGYTNPIVLDTIGWSWAFDPASADQILALDGNVVFSNHRYPNGKSNWTTMDMSSHISGVFQYASQYPILSGEHGWDLSQGGYVTGQSYPGWLDPMLDYMVNTAIPQGYNGAFAWAWDWCDNNSLTQGNGLGLNAHGAEWNAHFYGPLKGTSAPIAQGIPTPTTAPPTTAAPTTTTTAPPTTTTQPTTTTAKPTTTTTAPPTTTTTAKPTTTTTAAPPTTAAPAPTQPTATAPAPAPGVPSTPTTEAPSPTAPTPTVPPAAPPSTVTTTSFYKAINLNGASVAVNGKTFQSASSVRAFTVSGKPVCTNATAKPTTAADIQKVVSCGVQGSMLSATLDAVPNGTYQVYLYVSEPANSTHTFNLTVERQVVVRSMTMNGAGSWQKLGPFTATVRDNTIEIGSWSGTVPSLSGIEIYKVG
jgi:hypothetical protein